MVKKKAAMFGLDARIALAIFGALSIITGAVLFKVIEDIKVVRLLYELEEYSKAYEAYVLDTGHDMVYNAAAPSTALETTEIISSSESGWKGPYIQYSMSDYYAPFVSFRHPEYGYFWYMRATNVSSFGSYTDSTAAAMQTRCTDGDINCYNWVSLLNLDLDLAEKIDERVDGQKGANVGRLRVWFQGAGNYAVYYQIGTSLR
jgi:hypothetical protein